jgi:hypothetical protein
MSKSNDGGTAFPTEYNDRGLTMRDYFAAAALQGFSSQSELYSTPVEHLAEWAYAQADAMLAARKEEA